MGFNKRYISKESLNNAKQNGLNYLIKYINNPDCLIIEDSFSENIVNIIRSEKDVKDKLKKIGFLDCE